MGGTPEASGATSLSPAGIAWVNSLRCSRSFLVDVYVVTQRMEVIATRRVLFLYECEWRTRLAGGYQHWLFDKSFYYLFISLKK